MIFDGFLIYIHTLLFSSDLYAYASDMYAYIDQISDLNVIDTMSADPLTAILVGVIIISFLGIIILYLLKKLRKESDGLLKAVNDCEKVSILMHNDPDPDAMGSALAVERLIAEVGTDAELLYPGRIAHHENRAFRAVLDLSFDNIESANDIEGEKVILVDHHKPRGFEGCEYIQPDAVIDHHEGSPDKQIKEESDFWYIDSEMGACSTILTKFLDEQGIDFKKTSKDETDYISSSIATALFYGIMSDTSNLTQGVKKDDYLCAFKLFEASDTDKLHRISTPKIDSGALEVKAKAIMGREKRGCFGISDVGQVDNADAIPQAADELVRLEGVSAFIVFGDYNDNIKISGRAYDDRVHLGDCLEKAVQDIPKASAGGHSKMGGGCIPCDEFEQIGMTRSDLVDRLFEVLNGEN